MRVRKTVAACLALVLCAVSAAAPAPWYKWRSRLTGEETCAQVMHGEWQRVAGPFKDSRCETPGVPGA